MADEIVDSTIAPAASTAATVEAASSPATAPSTTEGTSNAQTSTTETPAIVKDAAEPAKVEPAVDATKAETLLGGEKKTEEAKPEEKSGEVKEGEKPAEVKDAEVAIPAYEPFKLPEGAIVDEAKMGEFTKFLGEFEVSNKIPHEEVQKLGQQMVERHISEMQRYTEALNTAWNKQREDWKESFLKDPEFVNRTDTAVNAAIDAIGVYAGNAKQQEEFRSLMESTGIGNHPAMIRMLSNVMLAKAEPKQLSAPQIATPAKVSRITKMYGKKSGS